MTDKVAQPFLDLAEHVDSKIEEAIKEKSEAALRPAVFFDDARNGGAIVLRFLAGEQEGREYLINPAALRRDSRDAGSIHELTGEKLLDPATISEDIKPLKITPQGNYAVAIQWSDGHDDAIYTFEQMIALSETAPSTPNVTVERKLKRWECRYAVDL